MKNRAITIVIVLVVILPLCCFLSYLLIFGLEGGEAGRERLEKECSLLETDHIVSYLTSYCEITSDPECAIPMNDVLQILTTAKNIEQSCLEGSL